MALLSSFSSSVARRSREKREFMGVLSFFLPKKRGGAAGGGGGIQAQHLQGCNYLESRVASRISTGVEWVWAGWGGGVSCSGGEKREKSYQATPQSSS